MKKLHMTPANLRIVLSVSLLVIAALAVAAAFISYGALKQTAVTVSHTNIDANASQNNLRILQQLQDKLRQEKENVTRAGSIVAESQSYQYQDQIIADLNDYAGKAGVEITNIDFSATTIAPTQAGGPSQSAAPSLPPPSGVKSTTVSVALKNPLNYVSLLRFLNFIEQNLTKMQISKVSLAKDATNGVSSEALSIEVYVR